jgi:uncharacterized protein with PQ loop repeat
MTPSELVGLSGAALAGYAYLPQIRHLIRERCSAGLSERAFALWLGSSLLMTIHAMTISSAVFVALGAQQIVSTGIIAVFSRRYRGQACPSHEPLAQGHQSSLVSAPAVAAKHGAGRRLP